MVASALDLFLEQIRARGDAVGDHIVSWHTLPAQPPEYGDMPAELEGQLVAALQAQGIPRLYVHQSLAVASALAGQHVVVVTPTASGKTLCYNLPVLNTLVRMPEARALYLFPTKALAHDQLATLRELLRSCGSSALAKAYDGDTPLSSRGRIRETASIVLSNPDMLHVGILPNHVRWRSFLSALRYVVLDEMHVYRGVFGSHVANVLRRLKRLCRFYGSRPQFICCSATIANPLQLAEKLVEEQPVLVSRNGAPRGRRTFAFINPPVVREDWGLRREPILEARDLANRLLDCDVQTVVFACSRRDAERLALYLQDDALKSGRDPRAIRAYRAGYLPAQRREVERGLREGAVRCVVATTALELGVDIGGLSASVMVGYPGTIASTWQQAGRAGRGVDSSAAWLIASSSPLDQYLIAHPRYLLNRSPEHALVNPDNLHVLLGHVQCAAYELPFAAAESYGNEDVAQVLEYLEGTGVLRKSRDRYYWAGMDAPTREVSLRTTEAGPITISCQTSDGSSQVLGEIDRATAPLWVHEGAIYLHEGQQYLVRSLDWEAGLAVVEPASVDYYTEASQSTRIDIQRTFAEVELPNMRLAHGEVMLTSKASRYRRLHLESQEHLGWGEIHLPERQLSTTACWLVVPEDTVERLREEGWWVGEHVGSRGPNWPTQSARARARDGHACRRCGALEHPGRQHDVHHVVPFREFGWVPGENDAYLRANHLSNLITLCPNCHRLAEQRVAVQSTLAGLARLLSHVAPLRLMCDPRDLGVQSDVEAPQTRLPTIFVYDQAPGGVGLSDGAYEQCADLLDMAAELVRDCPCESGCPACLGVAYVTNPRAKEQVLRLIAALQAG